jgi:hypothetical protein
MAETTPVEEMPLGMLIAWLSVFLAVVLFGVALPVIDVRWVVPFVVFAAVLFTGAFAGPFLLVRWLRSVPECIGPPGMPANECISSFIRRTR